MKYSNKQIFILILLFLFFFYIHPNYTKEVENQTITKEKYGYQIVKILKKTKLVYTQGLFFSDIGDYLYEAGGLYGQSTIRKMKYPSLQVQYEKALSKNYFGEGIAKCGNIIYQLTWRERVILKFQADNLDYLGQIPLDSKMKEGWGLSEYKSNLLIATDGSSKIYFLNCINMKVIKSINITLNGIPMNNINDLIYAKKFIFANKYFDNKIYKIDPISGNVTKTYDMTPLVDYEVTKKSLTTAELRMGNVLNGIAYNKQKDSFLLTGKMWGYFYEIKFE